MRTITTLLGFALGMSAKAVSLYIAITYAIIVGAETLLLFLYALRMPVAPNKRRASLDMLLAFIGWLIGVSSIHIAKAIMAH